MPPNSPTKSHVLIANLNHLGFVFDAVEAAVKELGYAARRYASSAEMLADTAALAEADVVFGFGGMPFTGALMATTPALRGIVSCVTGTEGIDVKTATERGIAVGNSPTVENYTCMAEATVLLMLALMYDFDATRTILKESRPRPAQLTARMMRGKKVGLVGFGRIARAVAALLAPWGTHYLVYAPRLDATSLPENATAVALDDLMRGSDIVGLFANLDAESRHMIDARRLALMKPSAFLVNVARGALIDESALIEVLAAHRIAGAALDAFETEPLPPDSPLRKLDNVILTPHQIGHTLEAEASLGPAAVENVVALLKGEVPPRLRNPQVLPLWEQKWRGRPV